MNKIENQFTSIQQVTDRYLNANSSSAAKGTSDVSFEEILKRKQDVSEAFELKFSKHAAMRLEDISIFPESRANVWKPVFRKQVKKEFRNL